MSDYRLDDSIHTAMCACPRCEPYDEWQDAPAAEALALGRSLQLMADGMAAGPAPFDGGIGGLRHRARLAAAREHGLPDAETWAAS